MSEQEFANAGELEAWLESKGVPPRKAADAAATLFDKDFDCPSTLEGISSIQLEKNSLTTPLAQLLHNKLKPKQEEKHIFSHGLPEIGPQFSRFASKLSLPTEERHAAACLQVSKFCSPIRFRRAALSQNQHLELSTFREWKPWRIF